MGFAMGRLPRRSAAWLLAAWLGICPAVEAAGSFVLPLVLPAGRVAAPLLSFKPATVGTWGLLRQHLPRLMSQALPYPELWAALGDEAGAAAAGPLKDRLSAQWWADLMRWEHLEPVAQERLREQFKAAYADAREAVAAESREVLARLAREAEAGRVGLADIEALQTHLSGLALYGEAPAAALSALRAAVVERRERRVAEGLETTAARLQSAEALETEGAPVAAVPEAVTDTVAAPVGEDFAVGTLLTGDASRSSHEVRPPAAGEREPLLDAEPVESRAHVWTRGALQVAGYLFLSAAAALTFGAWAAPQIADFGPTHAAYTWAGAGLVALGSLLGKSPQASRPPPQKPQIPQTGVLGWLLRRWTAAREWLDDAQFTVWAQYRLHTQAHGGAWRDKIRAAGGVLRTALYWMPAAFLSMAAAGGVGYAIQGAWSGADAWLHATTLGGSAPTLFTVVNDMLAGMVLADLVSLGLVFGAVHWGARRLGLERGVGWIAGVAAMAAFMALTYAQGAASVVAWFGVMGAQAVLIVLRAKTESLAAPMTMRLMFMAITAEVVRLSLGIAAPAAAGLVGLPAWTDFAMLGVGAALFAGWAWLKHRAAAGWGFLEAAAREELLRLRRLGRWWMRRPRDGSLRSPLRLFSMGFAWGVPLYLSMEFVYRAVQWLAPGVEPAPELLKRLVLQPLDLVAFNMLIVVALEEWVFRRGLFRPLGDWIKKAWPFKGWGAATGWWFWPAALASSLIFSAAHYVDLSGFVSPDQSIGLAMGYAFTWGGFAARAAGGMVLAFLFARTRTLLVPIAAHFASNMLASAGLRWGLEVFLVSMAVLLVWHFWQFSRPLLASAKPPKSS